MELGKIKDRVNCLIDNDSLKLEYNSFKTNLLQEFDSIDILGEDTTNNRKEVCIIKTALRTSKA